MLIEPFWRIIRKELAQSIALDEIESICKLVMENQSKNLALRMENKISLWIYHRRRIMSRFSSGLAEWKVTGWIGELDESYRRKILLQAWMYIAHKTKFMLDLKVGRTTETKYILPNSPSHRDRLVHEILCTSQDCFYILCISYRPTDMLFWLRSCNAPLQRIVTSQNYYTQNNSVAVVAREQNSFAKSLSMEVDTKRIFLCRWKAQCSRLWIEWKI